MAYKQLTKEGEAFIRKTIISNGNKNFTGKNKYAVPFISIPQGTDINSKVFDDNGNQTTDVNKFAELIIKWTNQYSKEYGLDANIMSAQQFNESGMLPWNYSESGAMGFTQFVLSTLNFWVFNGGSRFTTSEIQALSVGVTGDVKLLSTFTTSKNQSQVYNQIRQQNRDNLFQNIVDNPKIMIKAQISLMQYTSNRNNKSASSALFAYNRGSGLSSSSYSEVISKMANLYKDKDKTKKYGRDYTVEGLKYVENIFKTLNNGYGYKLDLAKNHDASIEVNIRTKNT